MENKVVLFSFELFSLSKQTVYRSLCNKKKEKRRNKLYVHTIIITITATETAKGEKKRKENVYTKIDYHVHTKQ